MNIYRSRRRSAGGVIIEVVIASALLATATVATAKFANSAARLDQQADARLAAVLIAENTIQRLRGIPYQDLESKRESVEQSVSDNHHNVDVNFQAMSAAERKGLHCIIRSQWSGGVITLHDWRFEDDAVTNQVIAEADRGEGAS